MDDAKIYRAMIAAAESGRPAVLATVVRARGSTPRSAGSKMLIDPDAGPDRHDRRRLRRGRRDRGGAGSGTHG